jgi:hypothetical protein
VRFSESTTKKGGDAAVLVKPLFSTNSSKMESIDTTDKNQNPKSPSPSRPISGEFEGILESKLEHR